MISSRVWFNNLSIAASQSVAQVEISFRPGWWAWGSDNIRSSHPSGKGFQFLRHNTVSNVGLACIEVPGRGAKAWGAYCGDNRNHGWRAPEQPRAPIGGRATTGARLTTTPAVGESPR